MSSKTPQFDAAIEKVLTDAQPGMRQCGQCQKDFEIFKEDIEFYKSFKVPLPKLCPVCRHRRRIAFRVRTPRFYRKRCEAPGHDEHVLSFFAEENPVKVYDSDYWWSDKWDPLEFGRDYRESELFFEQFRALFLDVPQQPLFRDPKSVNCDYVATGFLSKNCYYVGAPYLSEDVYYAFFPARSKNCIDVNNVLQTEFTYDSIELERCYSCDFSFRCEDCLESKFLFDCKNCSHCFGCTNLRNKQYCFFNEQLTAEEYKKRVADINLGSYETLQEYKKKFGELMEKAIRKNVDVLKSERVRGNKIRNSKGCYWTFVALDGCQNIRYAYYIDKMTDSLDLSGSLSGSRAYECTGTFDLEDTKFCLSIRTGMGLEYSMYCNNCDYCFGCIGLRNKKFCIFNKQYSEDEYWKKLDEIKTAMLERGEYGEFFPLGISPHPYNDTDAQIEYPLTESEANAIGAWWYEAPEETTNLQGLDVIDASDLPDDIHDVDDSILRKAIICEKTKKPFRIIQPELDFYRAKKVPLPRIHPLERILKRFELIYPFSLWPATCARCDKEIDSAHDPKWKPVVYCKECYEETVV